MFQTNVGWVIPVALILIAGRDSYKDYYSHWLSLPELYLLMEEPLVQAIDDLAITAPVGDSIYFSPLAAGHPLARYAEIRLAPRPVAAFASQDCVVTTETAAHYVSLVNFEPSFVRRLETFLPATALRNETDVATYHYQIYQTPSSASPSALATFGQALSLSRLGDLNPAYAPGETITLILGFQAKAPLDYAPSAFVHLYDQQNVPHDIVLLAQADRQLCVSYPAHLWQPDETIWQQFDLTLPDTLPAGRYLIAGGIYVFPAGPRLSIGEQLDGISDWVTLHEFETE